eukprot:2241796-Pyramimonas_sp.AAC.1
MSLDTSLNCVIIPLRSPQPSLEGCGAGRFLSSSRLDGRPIGGGLPGRGAFFDEENASCNLGFLRTGLVTRR